MIDSQIQSVIDMGMAKKLPTMLYELVAVEQGGLVSYSSDFRDAGHLSAKYVQQVLAGTSPAQLPVEGIDKLKFVINLKTAKQIGLMFRRQMPGAGDFPKSREAYLAC